MNRGLLGIAARNIIRNRRRTVLNMLALVVGMAIIIASLGWVRGYFTTLYDGMIGLDTGHLQVLHGEYREESRRSPLDLTVPDYPEWRSRFAEHPAAVGVSGRIHYELELGNGREYMPMRGRAIDVGHEKEVSSIHRFIREGSYPGGDSPGVLIGETAAGLLGVSVGDTVFLRVRDRYGAPNTDALPVAGVFRSGYPLFDRYMVFSELEATANFLRMDNAVTHLVLLLEGRGRIGEVRAAVQDELPEDLQAYRWERFAETMIAVVQADVGSLTLIMAILFLLILLGILNSMSMAVRERGRELGTMRAIGLKRRQLYMLLMQESLAIAVLSAVIACLIGGGLAAYIQFVGFDVAQYMPADLPIPFGDRFYGDYRPIDFVAAAGFGIAAAVGGTLLPARRAVHMQISDTMRSGEL